MKIRPKIAKISSLVLAAVSVTALAFSLTASQTVSATVPGVNELVNQSSGGAIGVGATITNHAISNNGRYVVFWSSATNLTPEASPGLFVRDTVNDTTVMASLSDTGLPVTGASGKISYDGRYVVFHSSAPSVVAGVTTGQHVYIRDLVNNTTRIVDTTPTGTVSSRGGFDPDVSADGRYVVFMTRDPILLGVQAGYDLNTPQVIVKDMVSGALRSITALPTQESRPYAAYSPGDTMYPSIDCDGRQVAFYTNNDYIPGTTRYMYQGYSRVDVYIATVDWTSNSIIRATPYGTGSGSTVTNADAPPHVTCNGNHVVLSSNGSEPGVSLPNTKAQAMKYDRLTSTFSVASANSSGSWSAGADTRVSAVAASDDGRYIAFTNNGTALDSSKPQTFKGTDYDLYIRDTKTGVTNLVSFTALGNYSGRILAAGHGNNISLSTDGSTVAFRYKTTTGDVNSELVSGVNTGGSDVYIAKTGF